MRFVVRFRVFFLYISVYVFVCVCEMVNVRESHNSYANHAMGFRTFFFFWLTVQCHLGMCVVFVGLKMYFGKKLHK